ncbi:MAG: exo-alpha-sialidase [Bacteroidales bacterium]|nr:exo-alpha-sialidase [Bacteroidales bacterium]
MKKPWIIAFAMLLLAGSLAAQPAHYITFNGTDQYVRIPHHSDFNIAADQSFTLTGWVRNETYTNFPRYVSKRDIAVQNAGNERTGYEFFGSGAEGQSLGLNTPTSTTGHALSVYTGVTIPAGEWMHFALVVDRANNIIRIHHDLNMPDDWSAALNDWFVANTHDVFIGAANSGGQPTNFCNGSFGNVRFYGIPLTHQEVLTDYYHDDLDELTTEMQANLLAAYDFSSEHITGNQLIDLSGHGHDGEMVNFTFGDAEILDIVLTQDTRLTGRGNTNDVLLKAAVSFGGTNDDVDLQSMTLNLTGTTDLNDLVEVKVFSTGSVNAFDERHPETATLIGSLTPASGDLVCELNGMLSSGTNYLWITAQVANDATEGNVIDASLKSLTTESQTFELNNPSPAGSREVILARTMLYQPGDYNSTNYRIPAVITAKDGSIVTTTDKRKFNEGDLPEDIDIVCNRSTDGGHTWSEPYTIALGTGVNHGFGDCALAWSNDDNGLIAGFVGGPGLWYSTPSNPIRTYIAKSYDNGQTWTEPVDITDFIFGDNCIVPEQRTWRASFFGSGNGLRTSTGRIIFVAAIRETTAQVLYNHAVYSDDNGLTWHVSGRASSSGDEAKVTELVDGRILMSIRHNGKRWYNISEDGGETWQPTTSTWNDITAPACNGDLIRYTSVNQGHDRNRLLHSVPYGSQRSHVSVYVSYDEGETWPIRKDIVPYSSAYSSLCVLPDGTIGLYVEEAYAGASGYSTAFYNFSLDWLTDGADGYDPTTVGECQATPSSLTLYPVPATSQLVIESEAIQMVKVYNVMGQLVKSLSGDNSSTLTLDLSELAPGTYCVVCIDLQGRRKVGKFIK